MRLPMQDLCEPDQQRIVTTLIQGEILHQGSVRISGRQAINPPQHSVTGAPQPEADALAGGANRIRLKPRRSVVRRHVIRSHPAPRSRRPAVSEERYFQALPPEYLALEAEIARLRLEVQAQHAGPAPDLDPTA